MGLTAERCVQRWPAVKEGQTVIDYCWDHRKPKAGEYNEQLVGREEVKESLKGIEKEAGKESKPNISMSLPLVSLTWRKTVASVSVSMSTVKWVLYECFSCFLHRDIIVIPEL